MSEQLAIIRNPGYGMRDMHSPGLWFTVYMSESSAALQVFNQPKADELIEEAGVRGVHDLDGKPCWVESEGLGGMVKFKRMWKK